MGYISTVSLLCEESCESLFGFSDSEEQEMLSEPESNMDLDLPPSSADVISLERDEDAVGSSLFDLSLDRDEDAVVGSLMEQEKEQLACIETGRYLERLNNGGIESAWRTAAIEWFAKVQAYYSFGPLCLYLAVNYLDRFLSSTLTNDKGWALQVLSVACLSLAAKMEETPAPACVELQVVCNFKHIFDAGTIGRMEVYVLRSLNWRMRAVTPFSYIGYFADKFNEGNPLTNECVSRCTELILGTLKVTKFLQFKPSEIAAAVVLYTVAETVVSDFSSALLASEIPVDKENVRKCHEAIHEVVALAQTNPNSSVVGHLPIPKSPSGVLNDPSFSFSTDDSQTAAGSSEATNDYNPTSYQPCTPVRKRTRG